MLKTGRLPIIALLFIAILFYGWSFLFKDNEWVRLFGLSLLPIVVRTISMIWLFQAYQRVKSGQRIFWLLLSIGFLNALIGDLFWFYYQISEGSSLISSISSIFWVSSHLFYLIALIYKTKEIGIIFSNKPYVFNIVIYMVTAIAISYHYLIKPVIESLETSLLYTSIVVGFQITDLGILFFFIILFHLVQHKREPNLMLFIVFGFLFQVLTDSIYAYYSVREIYQSGNSIDLLWIASSLFIGFAGFYAKDHVNKEKLDIKNPFEKREFIFPYASTMVLLILVITSYQLDFNALSFGLLIAFFMVMGRQITVINKHNKLLVEYRHLAYHDPLTGMSNRLSFIQDIENTLQIHKKNHVALLLIDIDRFKVINDTLGHLVGDHVLIKISERLRQALGTAAPIYRLGGDEFVIVIPEATEFKASSVAETVLEKFKDSFLVNDYDINITPSIGISIFPEHGKNSEDLLKNADAAMYLAKENGKNHYRFYNTELNQTMSRKMKIENELSKAIERNQLSLFYQPKVDLHSKKIIGMEALVRWNHPELGFISPVEFIPIAEETGQIVSIGKWVLNTACIQNKTWQEMGLSSFCISVNVSVLQFQQGDFLKVVCNALKDSNLDPQYLEIEITESVMQNINESIEIMEGFSKMGIQTSIDDFGTGYSSLHILRKLPIHTIKIDKSFIEDIEDPNQQPFIKAIIDLGLNLNLNVVAEGIENEEQLQILVDNKCTIGQGYLFSKPVDATVFEKMLSENKPLLSQVKVGREG
ncbi:bifunctional diguanylate cyclase/phosphodiesterase [Paenisporosarcina sp. TG20]|uniref:putative bifunctional diguanylate cyclase/phosphodiesterase n=1 Tax=Paenisporosarcina sp. TG20 TaxID=1211706 RepID=UPI0002FD5ADE|nr:EAL domain-containing protein [Paenisporosarcina sp. TG20]